MFVNGGNISYLKNKCLKSDSILNTRLNLPTIIATALAAIPAALAAEGSGAMTSTFGWIADCLTVGVSDVAHSISYNMFFPVIYGWMNRKHYQKNGHFDFYGLFYALVFQMLPAGWITATLLFHVPRNILQFYLIKQDFALWASSITADVIMTAVYMPVRNLILRYFERMINFLRKSNKTLC